MTTWTVPDLSPADIGLIRQALIELRDAGYEHLTYQISRGSLQHVWRLPDRSREVSYETDRRRLTVVEADGRQVLDACVTSPRRAVDLLVSIGVLPREEHSLAREVAELRAKLDMPCGSCHPCSHWSDETWRRSGRKPPTATTWDETREELRRLRAQLARIAEVRVWRDGDRRRLMCADEVLAALSGSQTPTSDSREGAR